MSRWSRAFGRRMAGACSGAVAATLFCAGAAVAVPADPGEPPGRQSGQGTRTTGDTVHRAGELMQRLTEARRRLEQVTAKAALASEQFNAAQALKVKLEQEAAEAKARADQAREAAGAARDAVHRLAAEVYMRGGSLDGVDVLVSPTGTQDLMTRLSGVAAAESYRDRTLKDATAVLAKADAAQRDAAAAHVRQQAAAARAEQARAAAQAEATAAASETAALEAQQTSMLAELAAMNGTSLDVELSRLNQADLEAARAALQEATKRTGKTGSVSLARRAAVAKALTFARDQLGKPYLWGGEGPDRWDCSGLTQAAWRTSGRALTHYTGSQWQETARVALSDLQPGDLVFFGQAPDAIHHVGLYVGDGMMIEAPRTGLNVRYAPIWRSDLIRYGGRP